MYRYFLAAGAPFELTEELIINFHLEVDVHGNGSDINAALTPQKEVEIAIEVARYRAEIKRAELELASPQRSTFDFLLRYIMVL